MQRQRGGEGAERHHLRRLGRFQDQRAVKLPGGLASRPCPAAPSCRLHPGEDPGRRRQACSPPEASALVLSISGRAMRPAPSLADKRFGGDGSRGFDAEEVHDPQDHDRGDGNQHRPLHRDHAAADRLCSAPKYMK